MFFEIIGQITEIETITWSEPIHDGTRLNTRYVVCVNNEGYAASLEVRKIYLALVEAGEPDHGLIRIIDESGEDYLYPEDWFVPVEFTEEAERAVSATF